MLTGIMVTGLVSIIARSLGWSAAVMLTLIWAGHMCHCWLLSSWNGSARGRGCPRIVVDGLLLLQDVSRLRLNRITVLAMVS